MQTIIMCSYCAISFLVAKIDVTLQVHIIVTQSGDHSCIGAVNF